MKNAQVLEFTQDRSDANEQSKPGWLVWLGWIVASLVSSGLVINFFTYAGSTLGQLDLAALAQRMLQGLVMGAAIGVAQWLVIRRYLTRAAWWIAATAIGWAAGMGVLLLAQTFILIRLEPEQWKVVDNVFVTLGLIEEAEDNYLGSYLQAGLLCGTISLIQLVALSGSIAKREWWKWVAAGILAGFALFRMMDLGYYLPFTGFTVQIARYILSFGAMSAITGAALIYLLRRKSSRERSVAQRLQ